jgi:hypothetical protein
LNQSKFREILNPIEPFTFLNRSKPFQPPPGTVLPRPACQPTQPPGTVVVAHRSATPPGSSVAWHGTAYARRTGAIVGCTEPTAVVPGPSLFLLPRATEPPSKQNAGRRPVPLFHPVPLSFTPKHVTASPVFTGTCLPSSDTGAHCSSLGFAKTLLPFTLSVNR